jgi:hypoxanthine phosphoribosyltransferase
MEDIKSKIYLTWDDIDNLVNILSKQTPPNITSVMGLPRGGLIPAVMLSHKLNLPLVYFPLENTLIVDDICDTGKTFERINANYFACLHYKPHTSSFKPTIWAKSHEGDEWLSYPWERNDSQTIQDYLK